MFFKNAWDMFIKYFPQFASGLGITLALSAVGVIFAAILGVVLCLMNISKYKVLKAISSTYIEVIRGIPLLLQLGVLFVVMPTGTSKFITCSIALIINSGAYQAEIFRSGIQSIDKGQMEAARSLGMSYWQAMFKIILPQAIRKVYTGEKVLSPEVSALLTEEMSSPGLTNRQLLQLELAARGFTNQEIANQLNVSLITVKKQFSDIFTRLNVSNRSEAVGFALQRHLISAH